MRRTGYTLVEALVAASMALIALGLMLGIFSATRKMTQSGDLAAALADAAIAMETIHRDLTQGVQRPDPANDRIVFLARDTARFLRGRLGVGEMLAADLVTYQRQKTATGHFKILRSVGGPASPLPGTYSQAKFKLLPGTGGPFVRVTLHVVARDAPRTGPAQWLDEAVISSLVRVAGPEMLNAPFFQWPFLDDLKNIEIPKS